MKKVVKFGGSSLASAEQFKKVGEIIRSDAARRYVVPSAPAKRHSGDSKGDIRRLLTGSRWIWISARNLPNWKRISAHIAAENMRRVAANI